MTNIGAVEASGQQRLDEANVRAAERRLENARWSEQRAQRQREQAGREMEHASANAERHGSSHEVDSYA